MSGIPHRLLAYTKRNINPQGIPLNARISRVLIGPHHDQSREPLVVG